MYDFNFSYLQVKRPYPKDNLLKPALEPSTFHIDYEQWQEELERFQAEPEEKRQEQTVFKQTREFIIQSMSQILPQRNWTLSFDILGLRERCGRRYPFLTSAKIKKRLLTRRNTDALKNKILLSGLHKKFRKTFRAKPGHRIIDWDLNRAHFTFLGNIANDEALIKAAKSDPHTYTGNLFGSTVTDLEERRNLGKRINSAIISGCTAKWLIRELRSNGIQMHWDDVQTGLDLWWERYPEALAYKKAHHDMISKKQQMSQKHTLMVGKRHLYHFDQSTLNGKNNNIETWPKTIEGRKLKAQRSAFSVELRAHEAYLMDFVFSIAHQHGMQLILPMYDGAMWQIPEDMNLDPFKADIDSLLEEFNFTSGFSIKEL